MDAYDLPGEGPPGPADAREGLHDFEELTALYQFPASEWFNERYICRAGKAQKTRN